MLRPGIGGRGAIGIEILSAIAIDVHRVSAHILVVGVATVVIVVVISVVVVGVVVAIAVMVATVIVSTVPGRISVIASAVINDRGTVPATVPTAISPSATSAAHHRADRNSSTERKQTGRYHIACGIYGGNVTWDHIGIAINHRGVVLRNIDDLRIGRLNHDRLRRLLHDCDLRAGLEIALLFSL